MSFLTWLESTGYVQWMLGSLAAYPAMLTVHAFGLALTVGVLVAIDLRLLGLYPTIPLTELRRFLGFAWVGIGLNVATGLMIFPTQATTYVTNPAFLVKMVFVALGTVSVVATQRALRRDGSSWEAAGQVPSSGRNLALGSIVFWTVAVATGRLIAYV